MEAERKNESKTGKGSKEEGKRAVAVKSARPGFEPKTLARESMPSQALYQSTIGLLMNLSATTINIHSLWPKLALLRCPALEPGTHSCFRNSLAVWVRDWAEQAQCRELRRIRGKQGWNQGRVPVSGILWWFGAGTGLSRDAFLFQEFSGGLGPGLG